MTPSRTVAVVSAVLAIGTGVHAQQPAAAPAMSQQQINEEMLKELRQIRQLLERLTQPQPPPQPTTARLNDVKGYALGRPDAPLTMVEFTDLQCPFCRQYAIATFPEIKKNWIDTGKLRYISHDFPLDSLHPQATAAARAARCAGEQGKFWDMRFALVTHGNELTPAYITETARDLKLDAQAFAACTASTKFDAEIQAAIETAVRLGVSGTPTFVVGKTEPSSVEGPMVVGALPYAQFDAALTRVLAEK
jgi:protein-disulfide isomerase